MFAYSYTRFTMRFTKKIKQIAILIDPDKTTEEQLKRIISISIQSNVDLFLVGSSLLLQNSVEWVVSMIKSTSTIPVFLFPGNVMQVSNKADGILLLSLISGRNAEMLIGQHVIAAPSLKAANFDIISTGYILIESGTTTSVEYMSNTRPIPSSKHDIAVCTAMAGEQLGMKTIYLEAGSGAKNPVPTSLISEVNKAISIPIWVGGGIKTPEDAQKACLAGADIIVIGSAAEENVTLIEPISKIIHQLNS